MKEDHNHLASPWGRIEGLSERACKLYLDGYSAAQVAHQLGNGLSRCAVIGRLRRLGCERPKALSEPSIRTPYPQNRRPYRRGGAKKIEPIRQPKVVTMTPPVTVPLNPRPWITRGAAECAFPVGGEGADTLSCCNPTGDIGTTYCRHHQRIMWAPSQPRPKDTRKLERLAA